MEFPEAYVPEDTGGFELLPAGEYVAQAIEGRIALPKSGNGYALTLVLENPGGRIRKPPGVAKHLFSPSESRCAAPRPANAQRRHCGGGAATPLKTVEPLLFAPVRLGIAIEADKTGAYPDKNRVMKVLPLDTGEAAKAVQAKPLKPAVAAAAVSRPAPAGAAPWHKK
jgi:hypothetical protein